MRACHDGKSTLSLKVWQASGSICRDSGWGARWDVDEGSKPCLAGVARALRFWVIESSIELRDMRRKSGFANRDQQQEGSWLAFPVEYLPLSCVVEKQNCGVRLGGTDGSVMTGVCLARAGAGARGGVVGRG